MTEEKTPYVVTPGQQRHEITERRLLAPGQVALLLDNGALSLMDSKRGVQVTLDKHACYDLLDMLYQHRDWLHQVTHQEPEDKP